MAGFRARIVLGMVTTSESLPSQYFSGRSAWPSLRGLVGHRLGRNSDLCTAMCPATMTDGILAY